MTEIELPVTLLKKIYFANVLWNWDHETTFSHKDKNSFCVNSKEIIKRQFRFL
jgi:hypothetical protein